MNGSAKVGVGLLLSATLACSSEPDPFLLEGDESYLMPPSDRSVSYALDSIVYDPAVGGTRRDSSSSVWRLDPLTAATGQRVYEVDVRRGNRSIAGLLWRWETRDRQSINTLDGVSLVGLIAPFSGGTQWDPLVYADPDLVVDVAGEPVAAYKRWGGRIDSSGTYDLPDGTPIRAVWVTLAQDENLLELREVHEIYGANEGLLERRVRILDTQNTDADVPWSERAERGFELVLKRM